MTLPIVAPYSPMEAKSVAHIPIGAQWQYEPKWDGFRCLAFRDGDSVTLQAKSGRLLTRYFPELVTAVRGAKAKQFILDGEIVIPAGRHFSFDDLLQRIHPAASRIQKLSSETPALLIVFDLLADAAGDGLIAKPLLERRRALEAFFQAQLRDRSSFGLSRATTELSEAQAWLSQVGSALDGVIAKRRDLPYQSGERSGMQKIKNYRSADCVVGGFRYNEGTQVVGSLLLGLYDRNGLLHHVGFTSSIKAAEKAALTKKLQKLRGTPGFTGNAPGGPSRWATERSGEWEPLRPELVVEVCYDHFGSDRFRHGTRLMRWRPDKAPAQCTFEQVRQKTANLLALLE